MYGQKWYLETWFISICFAFSILVFPAIAGAILLLLQVKENKKINEKYGKASQLDNIIAQKQKNIADLDIQYRDEFNRKASHINEEQSAILKKYSEEIESLTNQKIKLIQDLNDLGDEYNLLCSDVLTEHYKLSEYATLSSEECRNQLSLLKANLQDLVKSGEAVIISSSGTRKEINDNQKQIIRCFNTECDNVLYNITTKNIDAMRNKIAKSYETLNKIFKVDGVELSKTFLEYKLNELNLVYTYELKKEQEKEVQRAIKEQMIEEEKVRREIERQKAKIDKDQQQCTGEISKLTSYLQKTTNDAEKQLYIDKIRDLENRIKELETEKQDVLEREVNALAGYVYIISNIGSFGDDIYKIGMTRRLEPMDRIKELSSASVPFEFDVHAMIFSNNAPELETNLHKHFEKESVNRVNLRKEFFKVKLDDIEDYVKSNFNNTVQFTKIPAATEYRQTLQIMESET